MVSVASRPRTATNGHCTTAWAGGMSLQLQKWTAIAYSRYGNRTFAFQTIEVCSCWLG